MTRSACVAALAATALAGPVAVASGQTPGARFEVGVRSPSGALATISPQAAKAAVTVLDEGGNALDAAVTATFVNGVVRPELCGIGGGGTLVYRAPGGSGDTLDFREQSPVRYRYSNGVTAGPFKIPGTGNNVAGVPGLLAGMNAALERYGTISLNRAIDPAHDLARDGFLVTDQQAALFAANAVRLGLHRDTARIYLKNGTAPYAAGDRLVQRDYAETLSLITDLGTDAFYDGPVSEAIVAGMEGSDALPGDAGTMSLEDLAGYRPFWRDPLQTSYRSARVLTVPPPASGGLALVEALNVLEQVRPFPAGALSADRLHLLAEAFKQAWADRAAWVGDPRYTAIPLERLTSNAYAATRRGELSTGAARTYTAGPGAPNASSPELTGSASGATAQVSVVDAQGGAASITCSLEQPFGSAVVAPGTGFLLNSALTAFNAPGTGTRANRPAPRKRPRSSAAPALVTLKGKPLLVTGGAGGASVVAGVLSAIIDTLDDGLDAALATDAPRADARGDCAGGGLQLCLEDARIPADVVANLAGRGHAITRLGDYAAGPLLQSVGVDRTSGERLAVTDPRGGPAAGAAAVQARTLPALRLAVTPSSVRRGRRATLRFTIRGPKGAVRNAIVRFGETGVRTDSRGRATISGRFGGEAGPRRAIASKSGFSSAMVQVRLR